MATLYITSNADSGDGTLRNLIASASAGDIVEPAEAVFPRGTVCEITLASAIIVNKSLTIRGAHTKIRVDGGNAYGVRFDGDAVVKDCEFINLSSDRGPLRFHGTSAIVNCCLIAGCQASYGCGIYLNYSVKNLVIANCVLVGNKATNSVQGIHWYNPSPTDALLVNCTFAGNVAPTNRYLSNDVFVEKYLKTNATGMKIPPVVDETTWTPDLWKEWDLHTTETTTYSAEDCETYAEYLKADIQGFLREVDSSGQIVDSPGAYARQPVDLYWIGKDSNGNDVASPSFASEGWSSSPVAATGSSIPSAGQNLYVGKSVNFVDVPPNNATLYVGDCLAVMLTNSAAFSCSFVLGHGARANFSRTSMGYSATAANLRLGRFAWINGAVSNYTDGALDLRADENVYIYTFGIRGAFNPQGLKFYRLNLYGGTDSSRIIVSGTFVSSVASFRLNERYQFEGAVFDCDQVTFNNAPIDDWNTGTAPVFRPTTSVDCLAEIDFIVDLSRATSNVALNLAGQVVRNNVNGATLTGSARTEEVDLTKWTFNTGATLALVDGTMDFADGLINVYADKVLASLELVKATEIVFHNCFLGVADFAPGAYATTLSGSGYFATNDSTGVTTTGPKICAYGAGCSNFKATADRTMTVSFSVTKTDSSVAALLEKYDVETSAWTTVASDVSGASDSVSRSTTYRVFDGEKFLTATASVDGLVAYELAESFNLGYFSAGEVAVGYLQ